MTDVNGGVCSAIGAHLLIRLFIFGANRQAIPPA